MRTSGVVNKSWRLRRNCHTTSMLPLGPLLKRWNARPLWTEENWRGRLPHAKPQQIAKNEWATYLEICNGWPRLVAKLSKTHDALRFNRPKQTEWRPQREYHLLGLRLTPSWMKPRTS